MLDPFKLRWSVDQDGYEIKHVPTRTGPGPADAYFEEVSICPRGGPLREYRPMEDFPGLWRRFAECTDRSAALAFVKEFGLLFSIEVPKRPNTIYLNEDDDRPPSDSVKTILGAAATMRRIIGLMDSKRRVEAAEQWNTWTRPLLTAHLGETARRGKYEFKLIPLTLSAALFLQAGDAIALDQEWRRCRNDGCAESFRVGAGGYSLRREFCSTKCRVASSNSAKQHRKTGNSVKKTRPKKLAKEVKGKSP
jgi:hypothetical protein